MGAPARPELSVPLLAAVYRRGQEKKSFTSTELSNELKLKKVGDRGYVSARLYAWIRAGLLVEQPRTGVAKVYTVKEGKLDAFKPAPPPPPPKPAEAPWGPMVTAAGAPRGEPALAPTPPTFDGMLRQWLAQQLLPYGTMLKAAVQEIQDIRKDVDAIMDVLSRPEGNRPALPEQAPRPMPEALTQPPNGNITLTPVERRTEARETPVEDTALAVIVSRLGPEWHVTPTACRDFETLDSLTQARIVRALKSASGGLSNWPHLAKQYDGRSIPITHRRPGTWWAFRAGKKERLMIRRNGSTIIVEALVKRNDHRWYQSA